MYPVNLNLENKKAVIIGGGKIAHRKFQKLKEEPCHITVVSPEFKYEFEREGKALSLIKDVYRKKYIENADLIFLATEDARVNDQACRDAGDNQWVNHTGDKARSDFHNMKSVSYGDINIHVSSEGRDIEKVKYIATQLKKCLKNMEEETNE